MKKKFELTKTDLLAIEKIDSNYINNKGAALYTEPTYSESVEYYRLSAAMGDAHSISNLGYCYLYGRGIEQNTSLAVAYFEIAAIKEDVDACYKLGDIYSSDKWGLKDEEMSSYFYRMAASFIIATEWEYNYILYSRSLQKYPSLSFAIGRELLVGKYFTKDIEVSYLFLRHALEGYNTAIMNGDEMYIESRDRVIKLLNSKEYDEIREKVEKDYLDYCCDDFDDEEDDEDD